MTPPLDVKAKKQQLAKLAADLPPLREGQTPTGILEGSRKLRWVATTALNTVCAVVSAALVGWCLAAAFGADVYLGAVPGYDGKDLLTSLGFVAIVAFLVNVFGAALSAAVVKKKRRRTLERTGVVVVYLVWSCCVAVVLAASAVVALLFVPLVRDSFKA